MQLKVTRSFKKGILTFTGMQNVIKSRSDEAKLDKNTFVTLCILRYRKVVNIIKQFPVNPKMKLNP